METSDPKKFSFFLKGDGLKAVLLIHGITGTPSEMHYLGKALNKAGYTVLCNILPCHCGSLGELKKVTWGQIADFCAQDFKTLKGQYPKVFIGGLSMGALMAVHLAYKFPGEVSGIISLAPTLFYDGWALHKGKFLLDIIWAIPFLRNRINIREGWPYGLKDERLRESIQRFYKNASSSQYDDKVLLFGSPFFPLACLYQHHLFTKVVKKEIPLVKNPILILHARQDDMTSIKNAFYLLNNIASQDKTLITLQDSYHMITIDKEKDKVAQEAIKFLDKF
ncbi:MAG: alpha/beta fold hydrolase [Candidatus Omnitrophica bacterium]|nr:alpha/beta fold hydrolase [Candidatus Omnitrophota bacterium]